MSVLGRATTRVAVFAGAGLAVLAVAAFYVSGPAGSPSSGRTLNFFEHDSQQATLNLASQGSGQGDELVFFGDLFDHAGGTRLGKVEGHCTTVSGPDATGDYICPTVLTDTQGQLMTEWVGSGADLAAGQLIHGAITGGSGTYRNARGDGTVQLVNPTAGTDYAYELHLN